MLPDVSLFSNNEIIGNSKDYSDGMNFMIMLLISINNSMLFSGKGIRIVFIYQDECLLIVKIIFS
jgi:hypothetical protein